MISPTGQGIRRDPMGRGEYGASRGSRIHTGADYLCTPGQRVWAPIAGLVVRIARPYAKGPYSGLFIQGEHMAVKLFYLAPNKTLVGKRVLAGETIGTAQDISEKHGVKMFPHIHLEICSFDPELLINDFAKR